MILIDGNNLLWSVQKTDEEFSAVSDVRLCHILGRYLRLIKEKGEIIFDGVGPQDKGSFDNIVGLEVFFAGLGVDADSVIEDKIKASTDPIDSAYMFFNNCHRGQAVQNAGMMKELIRRESDIGGAT